MYHSTLRPTAQRQLQKIGQADLVIGLPSYKNPQTAAQVAAIALAGAHHYYPQLKTILINADAGLKATTRQAVLARASTNGHQSAIVSGRYKGILGQGNAIAALLDAALALDAKAIIILDSNTRSFNTNWIAGLAHLIIEDKADLVIPRYWQWLSSDGLLSDLIVYPLFRALWGQNVRCPAAPDFALSPQLAAALLDEDIWGTAAATNGLPSWLVTFATVENWRVVQTALGEKDGDASNITSGALSFKARFHDTLSVIFGLAARYPTCWQNAYPIRSLSTLTEFASKADPANSVSLPNPVQLLDKLALGWIEYRTLWQRILAPENLTQIEALAALPPDRFHFPADLWARILYDFVVVFNEGDADPVQVVDALYPLFQGRVAAFLGEVAGLALAGREGTVAAQAVELEEARSYLQERWRSYNPFK